MKVNTKFRIPVSLWEGEEGAVGEGDICIKLEGKYMKESLYHSFSALKLFIILNADLGNFKQNCRCFHPTIFRT